MPRKKQSDFDVYINLGLNDLSRNTQRTVRDFHQGYKRIRKDYKPIENSIRGFLAKRNAKKQLRNVKIFGQNIRNKRNQIGI